MKNTLAMIMLLAAFAMTRIPVEALNRASTHIFGLMLALQMTFWAAYAAQCGRDLFRLHRSLRDQVASRG